MSKRATNITDPQTKQVLDISSLFFQGCELCLQEAPAHMHETTIVLVFKLAVNHKDKMNLIEFMQFMRKLS